MATASVNRTAAVHGVGLKVDPALRKGETRCDARALQGATRHAGVKVARDELLSLLLRFKSLLYLEESLQKVKGNSRVLKSTK